MKNLIADKIEVKKTKVTLSVSLQIDKYTSKKDAFNSLVAIAVLNWSSANIIKQVCENTNTKEIDFEKIQLLKERAFDLFDSMLFEISKIEKVDRIKDSNVIFK